MAQTKIIPLEEIIPRPGDTVTITNRGKGIFAITRVTHGVPPLELTDEDIEALKKGEVTFQ